MSREVIGLYLTRSFKVHSRGWIFRPNMPEQFY